jgi:hypothetical protein
MEKRQQYGLLQGFEWRRDSNRAYYRVSNGEETAIWLTTGFRMEKRQQYGLLQGLERRRDTDMVYCSVSNGEETAIWPTAGF